jgi:hypothetical protein
MIYFMVWTQSSRAGFGAISKRLSGSCLTARLDFQRYQLAGFLQNEIHFMSGTVAPEMYPARL